MITMDPDDVLDESSTAAEIAEVPENVNTYYTEPCSLCLETIQEPTKWKRCGHVFCSLCTRSGRTQLQGVADQQGRSFPSPRPQARAVRSVEWSRWARSNRRRSGFRTRTIQRVRLLGKWIEISDEF